MSFITTIAALATLVNRDDMPTVSSNAMPLFSATSESFSTPSVTVPPSHNNPYILKTSGPLGVVFIAVGCVVAAILLAFAFYHLYKSLNSSRLAKRTLNNEKFKQQRYSGLFGSSVTPVSTNYLNTDYPGSVAKLPILNSSKSFAGGSQVGDNSTLYNYDGTHPTTHHDLTRMFVSPTKEVMSHNRTRSHHQSGSVTNVSSLYGRSSTNLNNPSPATNRHSQLIPNLYINEEINNSDYSVALPDVQARQPNADGTMPREGKKTLPSMYLEDLIDK